MEIYNIFVTKMKHLLTLLLFISTSVMAESFLCISDAAGGATYDEKTKTYKSTVFKTELKYILKKEGDKWTFNKFGKEPDMLIYDCKREKSLLTCKSGVSGQFLFAFTELRYVYTSPWGYYPTTDLLGSTDDVFVEIGACSKI